MFDKIIGVCDSVTLFSDTFCGCDIFGCSEFLLFIVSILLFNLIISVFGNVGQKYMHVQNVLNISNVHVKYLYGNG